MNKNMKQEHSNVVKNDQNTMTIVENSNDMQNANTHSNKLTSAYSWFYGNISREDAENLLTPRNDGVFLVRESTSFPGDFTLCVCYQHKIQHYRVQLHGNKVTIDDEEFFDSLEALIEHYKNDADGLCTKLTTTV